MKEEFLKTVGQALQKSGGNPVSVINGGHYLTIVGIQGRNLICKDSVNRSDPDKNEYHHSVDSLFNANMPRAGFGGAVEITWMEPITEETMADVKEEFPEVATDYERLRAEGKDLIMPAEYAHTHGIDFERDIKKSEDPVLEGLIKKRVYLPKQKPGEKVKSRKQIVTKRSRGCKRRSKSTCGVTGHGCAFGSAFAGGCIGF